MERTEPRERELREESEASRVGRRSMGMAGGL